ncbi:exodeoxyribonuclease VII large subunit [Tundrisphaera sp. TA3]|uniref:exodeoxyribonuclease VII large subunit n=1 Tax=Tundrisphaera sp. TA3 TaxID=3435775 RepID=UPI003EB7E9F1
MPIETRIDLHVPFAQKDDAKALGARWDGARRTWYAPPGTDLEDFRRWMPPGFAAAESAKAEAEVPEEAEAGEKGVGLSELLAGVKRVIDRGMPAAAWVRAEISELRSKNGHVYLTLTERDERGDALANAKGILWKTRAAGVAEKFERATGEGLKPDIKILCLARVRFEPLFGLDLIIEDVDPSYTLGDLAAKLARIRRRLADERLIGLNRALAPPVEYVRVAVISPETSAGLGDFRRETDRLQAAGLCLFAYHGATFQGPGAPSSIRTAINEALAGHRRNPYDALVVIRGGGSATDLAWLNDLELARLVCQAPIPVLTGIGHERDGTILDEVAHRRFDTPSKVALHISHSIRDNAFAALAAAGRIETEVARILAHERGAIDAQAGRVEAGAVQMARRAGDESRALRDAARASARSLVREAATTLDLGRSRLIEQAGDARDRAEGLALRAFESIAHRSQIRVEALRSAIARVADAVAIRARNASEAARRDVDHQHGRLECDAKRAVEHAAEALERDRDAIAEESRSRAEEAREAVANLARIVVGLGPRATLLRGFALARDGSDRPITGRDQARTHRAFTIQFRDGAMPVTNPDFQERDAG